MTDKRYQVFISSTYADLSAERAVLTRVLPPLGCLPVGLDLHPQGGTAWNAIKKLIDDCDYYLLLVGSRYGSLSPSGVSYTHMEYVYAATKQKPILVLLHDSPETRPPEFQERTAEGRLKFNDFRQLLLKGMTARWSHEVDLEAAVRQQLPLLTKTKPMPGWVRATQVSNPEMEKEHAALKQRLAELEQERDVWIGKQVQSQGLAHGADAFELNYRCKAYALGNCEDVMVKSTLSFNDLFASFAPYLSQPQTEDFVLAKLNERVQETALADVQKTRPKAHAITDVQLAPLTFNTLKIQFRTLGLIRRVPKPNDAKAWWQLTTLGEQNLATLLAVKRPGRPA